MLPNPVFMGSVSDFMICGKRETVTVLSIHRLMNKDSVDKLQCKYFTDPELSRLES